MPRRAWGLVDSSGMREWLNKGAKPEDLNLLANGFYIADRYWSQRNGNFVPVRMEQICQRWRFLPALVLFL